MLYAAADADDTNHVDCANLLERHPGPLLVPQLIVTEVCHLIETRLGPSPEVRFISAFVSGALISEPVAAPDWERIAELVWQYRDLRLGCSDASIVAAAERLGIREIATLDRRHFGVVRPKHTKAFVLLPARD